MGANMKHFNNKYCVDDRHVYVTWKCMCGNNEEVIRLYMQVKE